MKTCNAFLLAAGLAWQGWTVDARGQTNDAQRKALDVLHKTIDSLEQNKAGPIKTPSRPTPEPDFEEVQRQYLEGKISAKEFQKYLNEHKVDPAKLPQPDATSRALDVLGKEVRKNEAGQPKPAAPQSGPAATKPDSALVSPSANSARDPAPSSLSEVEKKMDELLALKAARERAAATNSAAQASTNSTPAAPKPKRDRLNDLLREVVAGKITDAEYKEKRAKIISEPD